MAAFAADTDRLGGWSAVVVEDDVIAAIRALNPQTFSMGDVRDYERMAVELIGADALPDSDEAQ